MNKKRVALALAAALGINTLMVTVGQVGEQTVVAHAAGDKLVTGEDEARREALVIKHLETTASNLSNGDVSVTFDNVNNDLIANVQTQGFTHAKFKERETIDNANGVVTGTWNDANDTLVLSGIKEPGIYTGVVVLTYTDGSEERYTVSLVKKDSDRLEIGNVTVNAASVRVGNITVNGTQAPENSEVYLVKKGEAVSTNSPKAKITTGTATFSNVTGLSEGQVYELVYVSGNYEARAQILMVKQATPTVAAIATNSGNGDIVRNLQSQVAFDFGVSTSDVTITNASDTNSTGQVKVNGVDAFKFNQHYVAAGKPAGAALTASSVGNELKINLGAATTVGSESNFVPNVEIKYGTNPQGQNNTDKGLIGEYVVKIGDEPEKTYFDATSKVSGVSVDNQGGNKYLKINSISKNINPLDKADFSVSLDKFSHGYSTVDVGFGVKESNEAALSAISFAGKTIEEWNTEVASGVTNAQNAIKATISGVGNTGIAKASVIVSVDRLDGVQVTPYFNKTSESTGELTLKGAASLVGGNASSALTISGATVTLLSSNNGDLKYGVTYNQQIPSTINWSLNVDTSLVTNGATLSGTVETGVGVVETVNFDDNGVTTTNQNTTNLRNQFDLVAKFGSEVPTGATLGFENQTGLRVSFDTLGTGAKTIKATSNTGKYQGTYAAGIWVQDQEFVIELKSTNIATSNSITLAVEATEIVPDSLDDIVEAWLEYKPSNVDVWIDDRTDKIDLRKLVSEQEFRITKTGLRPDTFYDFRIAYHLDGDDKEYYSNIVEDEDTLQGSSSGGNTITGGGGTTSGNSTGSITITVTGSNSNVNGTVIDVILPSGFRYDSGKSPVVTGIKYKDKDGKIVTESRDQFSNVAAKFNGSRVELIELVSGKNYAEIIVDYTDNTGKVRTIILKDVKVTSNLESDKYLANIYDVVFGRPADESGYHYHLRNLKNKVVSLREFVLNMLGEKEFIEKYKSTESKIEALYSAIVNRTADEVGKKFWVEEYRKVLAVYGNETSALRSIADRMVNEGELRTLAEKMNFKW